MSTTTKPMLGYLHTLMGDQHYSVPCDVLKIDARRALIRLRVEHPADDRYPAGQGAIVPATCVALDHEPYTIDQSGNCYCPRCLDRAHAHVFAYPGAMTITNFVCQSCSWASPYRPLTTAKE